MATVADLSRALVRMGSEFADREAFDAVVEFMQARWDIPSIFVVGYLAMVYVTREKIRPHGFLGVVDASFALWNLGLSLFSTWGFWNMIWTLREAASERGLHFTICADSSAFMAYTGERPAMLALCLFCLSKIPELGDTVFLILKRKPVRFLQWYHHATVMLFCWLALSTKYMPGLWFAATNYFVHSIMYMYFCLMTFKQKTLQKVLKRIAPFITIIQISQMVWGLILNGIAVGTYFSTGNCQIKAVTVYAAVVMYASYFWLFSQLFLESRKKGGKNGQPAGVVRSVSRAVSKAVSQAMLNEMGEGDGEADEQSGKKVN
jgi:hypothetical protein